MDDIYRRVPNIQYPHIVAPDDDKIFVEPLKDIPAEKRRFLSDIYNIHWVMQAALNELCEKYGEEETVAAFNAIQIFFHNMEMKSKIAEDDEPHDSMPA